MNFIFLNKEDNMPKCHIIPTGGGLSELAFKHLVQEREVRT